ncbi:MAG: hypothetical protein WBG32_16210 [Nodosilinea sp.]
MTRPLPMLELAYAFDAFISDCGTVYYSAEVLKNIERQFFAIRNNIEAPDQYLQVPVKST